MAERTIRGRASRAIHWLRSNIAQETAVPSPAFEAAMPFVLRWEGGFVDHPNDPGGRTNKGVTQRVYDAWRRRQGLPARDVKRIGDSEMHRIYESGYWVPPRCDLLARQLDLVQFDTAVNMGPGRAVRLLQGAVGTGVDGDFGPKTERAVAACDLGQAMVRYCDAREAYYRGLVRQRADLGVFLRGWLNRLNALRREVGLPGYESAAEFDPGDAGYIRRIPDIGEDPDFDF
jgi:lysozyme family protein